MSSTFPLWGETLAGSACTLLGAYVNHESGTPGGLARREVAGPVFVRGAHLRELADLPIERARLRFPGLREFLWHPHFGPVGLTEREDGSEQIHERIVVVPGARLTFRLAWETKTAVHEQRWERPGEVDVTLDEPVAFDRWMMEWVRPLQDLLVFAMREPSRPEAFVACFERQAEPLWWRPNDPPQTEAVEVEFVEQESRLLLPKPRWGYTKLLFSLGELGDDVDAVLARWFELHRRLDPSAGFLFGALNTRLKLENTLLNLTSAAEDYHRELYDERPLTEERHDELGHGHAVCVRVARGERCVRVRATARELAVAATPTAAAVRACRHRALAAPRSARTTRQPVGGARNYVVHQDARHEDVRDGDELSLLLQRLVLVLQANTLPDLGFPAASAAGYLRRSYEGQRVLRLADREAPDRA